MVKLFSSGNSKNGLSIVIFAKEKNIIVAHTHTFFLRVLFAGRVQGVGFRWSTLTVAKDFTITGFVKNLPDGKVELIAEGEETVVRSFLEALRSKMALYVEDCQVVGERAPRRYEDFSIAY